MDMSARPIRSLLRPGPKMIVICLPILPAGVIALSTTQTAQLVSALMASAWLVLVPSALFGRWAARLLPAVSILFVALAVLTLPFGSAAFIADVASALLMFFLTAPPLT